MLWNQLKLSQWNNHFIKSRKQFFEDIKNKKLSKHMQNTIAVIVDHLLGISLFIILYKVDIFSYVFPLLFRLINFIEHSVKWFITNPGGFKFNINFNYFLSSLSLFFLHFWRSCLIFIVLPSFYIFKIITFASLITGITGILSFFNDTLVLIFLPIELLSVFFSGLEQTHLSLIVSLFRLFMGTKYNPLRKRVDTLVYEQDNFLLGTILFALLVFLLPTSIIYYLYFTFVLMIVQLFKKILSVLIVLIVEFPIDDIIASYNQPFFNTQPHLNSNELKLNTNGEINFDTCCKKYITRFNKTFYISSDMFSHYKQSIINAFNESEND
ncbi:N-acetylglucosaminyl transferase [Entamoeba histolytica HM-3:IMSS]|uniref:N-acetylglucosaminyl transferase, putative n=4 Tax=Entamoeba histolytica TaxID=5759 RepID=C4LWK1_ENTH1|nr:N-acetylglucosaminyl transferase, putative [Entamoeba histolytica HM-1:IMSS]EAL49884.1 N-acetylglucosaminyl transferase, putative [Entamoeba histolytica HM-1:IMSS]EMD46366.1 N-acetylglucosaminyl transferase, putative [Entamoeba histolytica KU27]EMS15967.1 N-acetylglucosaminyl transferase [Entamoeba histolytica HM-3:IMSS]GAT93090.1 N-acetylglucosaminyl transferase putative [Entamoeba histolytica]|eukprot:XP_655272.1 N-acetylglucosaminyl transferase, putative [Entamoeba histolytica HM-1:IMSS]